MKICLKQLIRLGCLVELSCDIGILLRLIISNNVTYFNETPTFCEFQFKDNCIVIQNDPVIYPLFRLYNNNVFIGYAIISTDSVGRVALKKDVCNEVKKLFYSLSTPCVCRAGHLLVVLLRYSNVLQCSCDDSLLKCIQNSYKINHRCPITFNHDILKQTYKEYSIALAYQRNRLKKSFMR